MKKQYIIAIILLAVLVIGGCAIKNKLFNKSVPEEKSSNSLLLDLKFNDMTDSSDYKNIIEGIANVNDGYVSFDGNSFLKINKDFNNKDLSIGFWIKPIKRQSGFVISNGPVTNTPSLSIFFDSFKRLKFNRGKQSTYSVTGSLPYDSWTFVFITNDGSKTKYYINGILKNEDNQEYIINTGHTETFIGKGFECSTIHRSFRCSDDFFYGNLDDLRIYNEVLTEEQIKSIYQETKKL
ncbi:LamG domain-containing protein [Candidatus Woesearchaeota archaeon]|nr:LamG domain-containing protein [Candidatus Woesearchaeota archaeon]